MKSMMNGSVSDCSLATIGTIDDPLTAYLYDEGDAGNSSSSSSSPSILLVSVQPRVAMFTNASMHSTHSRLSSWITLVKSAFSQNSSFLPGEEQPHQ